MPNDPKSESRASTGRWARDRSLMASGPRTGGMGGGGLQWNRANPLGPLAETGPAAGAGAAPGLGFGPQLSTIARVETTAILFACGVRVAPNN